MREVGRRRRRARVLLFTAVAALSSATALSVGSPAWASTFDIGDVFAGFGDVTYDVYTNAGTFKENISTGQPNGFATGCAFDANENFYATTFSAGKIVVLDKNHPHGVIQTIDAAAHGKSNPESIVFAQNGDFYVGGPFGGGILRFNAAGVFQQAYNAASAGVGTDWIDLAVDQRTIFYTGEGTVVKRYDVASDTQLADFATLPDGQAFALRLLPPGDGSGGLIVADRNNIRRLDGTGAIVQEYDAPNEDFWFALNLDPNGTSFWSAGLATGNLYRFNIQTGAVEVGPIATGKGVGGLCVKGELTAARPPDTGGPGQGPPQQEPGPTGTDCAGRPATIAGTDAAETIRGTDGPDVINARGGDDVVRAGGGNDVICGKPGNDRLLGQGGEENIRGNKGDDTVSGGGDDDELHGNSGTDRVSGDAGNDFVQGGSGRDRCDGGRGRDEDKGCQRVRGIP